MEGQAVKGNWKDHVLMTLELGIEFQEKFLDKIESELIRMPEGAISKKAIKGRNYYYQNIKAKNGKLVQRYIKLNENELKENLMIKYYYKKCMGSLKNNIPLMRGFIQKYKPVMAEAGEFGELNFARMIFDKEGNIESWKNEDKKSGEFYASNLIHTTNLGERVRSKSEVLIARILEGNGIPYKYEVELKLGDKTYYPDFTILSPVTGKEYYWEHFGMLSVEDYKEKAARKLQTYFRNGIYPCEKLILTYDKEDGSFDAITVQNLIDMIVLKC
ncbi:MAG: hypothetical protein WCQ41_03330 [Bacillota bacterium]